MTPPKTLPEDLPPLDVTPGPVRTEVCTGLSSSGSRLRVTGCTPA